MKPFLSLEIKQKLELCCKNYFNIFYALIFTDLNIYVIRSDFFAPEFKEVISLRMQEVILNNLKMRKGAVMHNEASKITFIF